MNIERLQPWESLMKQIVWKQIGTVTNKKILDFGSGRGITANYFAENNDVTAIEPSLDCIENRWCDNHYHQIHGSIECLYDFLDEFFDIIICHNVLEYAQERVQIIKEFSRLLKTDGYLSLVKHNRPGRIMQMIVLLNDFEEAHALLNGKDSVASKFGDIHYYKDSEIEHWCDKLCIVKTMGIRTFWDLQQNQDIQKRKDWQKKMVDIEMRVSEIEEFQKIAFFHHLIINKLK